ncbi:hypothetical protein CHU98_g2582 [Xylaria longipes]|nr:hypothetical protein CHU98_g2582 [Xylaria longipes]
MWEDAKDDATVLEFTRVSHQQIRKQTETLGLYKEFIYLGGSSQGQSPFESYAKGSNVAKLETIRKTYDPGRFLEHYLHTGFRPKDAPSPR